MPKHRPLYTLRAEGRLRDNDVFNRAHTGAGTKIGVDWLAANQRVVQTLNKFGYDPSDERVKALVCLAVRAALDPDWAEAIKNEGNPTSATWYQQIYSSELEIPERRR